MARRYLQSAFEEQAPKLFDFTATVQAHGWVRLRPFAWHAPTAELRRIHHLRSGRVVRLRLRAAGTVDSPVVRIKVEGTGPLLGSEKIEIRQQVHFATAKFRVLPDSFPLLDQVVALARMAQGAGLEGVVASPHDTPAIRAACGPEFTIVTPGIRGAAAGAAKNDQIRTMGPAEAIRAGANYIVVGRPIIAAPDPRAAAEAIAQELR